MTRFVCLLVALLFGALGLLLIAGGSQLLLLGGSAYYVLAGIVLVVVAILIWRRRRWAAWLYALFFAATIVWALIECGMNCWSLLPRLGLLAILGLWFALPFARAQLSRGRVPLGIKGERWIAFAGPALFIVSVALLLAGYRPFVPVASANQSTAPTDQSAEDWRSFGGDRGDRFSSANQITTANVHGLVKVWSADIGGPFMEGPPLKIGDALIACTATAVTSVDADTGARNWRYEPKLRWNDAASRHCRGVAYVPGQGTTAFCDQHVLWPTVDDQMRSVDLATGRPCPEFGANGVLDLSVNIGASKPGYHLTTSPPLIFGNLAVFSAKVKDGVAADMPSGVVRAIDNRTGKLVWAFDVEHPSAVKPLAPDEVYPRSSPNAWGVFSADADLNLIYVPTGEAPPDYFGGDKTPDQERYADSIVALDARSGDVRWSFQTTHHGLWDSDIATQPIIVNLDRKEGRLPALVVATKRGEVFVLDRRTGAPIVPVREGAVPQGGVAGERVSPTQPFPEGFPSFVSPHLTERDLWGVTPVDQMFCRIKFRQARYEGPETPPGLRPSIGFPDAFGVFDWGSVAVDPERQIMFVNGSYLPMYDQLVPRQEADNILHRQAQTGRRDDYLFPQAGARYAMRPGRFTSILGFPCNQPPWGEVAAVDLRTDRLLWRRPFGTTRDIAPLGIALPTGVFNMGGAVMTRSGLAFIGAAMDDYLRAYDVQTGSELWRARLPAGAQSIPITYISKRTGRQYVVIAATGHLNMGTRRGNTMVAYALAQ